MGKVNLELDKKKIGIIILILIVIVAVWTIHSLNIFATCCDGYDISLNYVESEMSEFVNNLEETANNKSSTKFIFSPQVTSFDTSKHIMQIVKEDDIKVCSAKCGIPQESCFVMTFYTDELALGYKEKCLNLPVYTTFATSEEECISSEELEGFSVIDPNERLPFGEYILKNVAREGDTWPNICTYYKE